MGLIILIVVGIAVLCILHETLPRVFDAFFSGIGVGVVAGIVAMTEEANIAKCPKNGESMSKIFA